MLSLKSTYHILEMVMKMKGAAHFYFIAFHMMGFYCCWQNNLVLLHLLLQVLFFTKP